MAPTFYLISINIVAVFWALFTLLYFYFTRNFNFWKKRNIPFAKPLPFVGNLKESIFQTLDIGQNLKQIYDEHKGKPYVGFFSFDQPSLLINDPDLVKCILVKDARNFINRVQTADEEADPLTAKAVFALKDKKWRHIRLGMTPIFTTGKMKKMFYLVDKCAKELTLHLEKKTTTDDCLLDVKDWMARYTIDVISSCAFGIESNTLMNPDAEFRRYLRRFTTYTALKSFATLAISFAPKLQSFLKLKILDDDIVTFVRNTVWSTVEYREANNLDRKDFLDNMMELRRKGRDSKDGDAVLKIDGDDFVAQSYAFLLAGFETSATTMAFALYELSLQPAIQQRLRTEISTVLGKHDQELTYETVQEMSYLEKVIFETLRKYPIVPYLDRMCISDYEIPVSSNTSKDTIPAQTGVYIPVYAIHHDPQYYPEPETFDPERFTEENVNTRPQFTYLPFGEGPRICLGMRFALMQTKTGLINLLSRFEVAPCRDTPVPLKIHPKPFLLQSQGEIPLMFKRTKVLNS